MLVPLTRGKFAVIDKIDAGRVGQRNWQAVWNGRHWYANSSGSIKMHRYILDVPEDLDTDHEDGDGLNNRRRNIRVATTSQNSMNRGAQRNSCSGYKGVFPSQRGRKWIAVIRANGKVTHIGTFATPEEAARAYDEKALILHGEFARLNFS